MFSYGFLLGDSQGELSGISKRSYTVRHDRNTWLLNYDALRLFTPFGNDRIVGSCIIIVGRGRIPSHCTFVSFAASLFVLFPSSLESSQLLRFTHTCFILNQTCYSKLFEIVQNVEDTNTSGRSTVDRVHGFVQNVFFSLEPSFLILVGAFRSKNQ